jgi:hypothetical protein
MKFDISDDGDTFRVAVSGQRQQIAWEWILIVLISLWMYKNGISTVGILAVSFLTWLDMSRVLKRTFPLFQTLILL